MNQQQTTVNTITPNEANNLCASGLAIIINVRTPAEYAGRHARGAVNLPLDKLNKDSLAQLKASTITKTNSSKICVICESGGRSRKAALTLIEMGEHEILDVQGGTRAWVDAGLPINQGQGVISLDRQVRIAAGFIVVIGVVLGYIVSSGWFLLSGFVGAGLMFAGITDTCGLAMVLGKMPWNRKPSGSCGTCCQ